MRRRNEWCGKGRRPIKCRSKITEGIYGSALVYVKFVAVWALVLMADFILEFRFEYLWPFWLLLRSVYDSFKYQGLAFSVFFVCIAVTSDVICYLFLPVQWLFFAASTYVWVQYVWHTERGICLPTVSLWLLFVYIEASVRLRDFKSLPFHLDLCRPFAAHCIGYPVVTLGFGCKSYISYRLRLNIQKKVQKQNEVYVELLQQSLPPEQQNIEKQKALTCKSQEEVISNGTCVSSSRKQSDKTSDSSGKDSAVTAGGGKKEDDIEFIEQASPASSSTTNKKNVNDFIEDSFVSDQNSKNYKAANGVGGKSSKLNSQTVTASATAVPSSKQKGKLTYSTKDNTAQQQYTNNREDSIARLEADLKRLKADLQCSRNTEQELRAQINGLAIGDKSMKSELFQLRQDNESLQNKLHNLVISKQQDKQNLAVYEKRLSEERKIRTAAEQQLAAERKAKKNEDAAAARAVALAQARECTETCKARRRDLDNEIKQVRRELKVREDQLRQMERDTQALLQYKDCQQETEVLMGALTAMQDKNSHLESSLSAETKLKLDLFSALGEANRKVEIQQALLMKKQVEIDEMKLRIAEVMALVPSTVAFSMSPATDSGHLIYSTAKFSPANTAPPSPPLPLSNHLSNQQDNRGGNNGDVLTMSSLNPNASDYTPMTCP